MKDHTPCCPSCEAKDSLIRSIKAANDELLEVLRDVTQAYVRLRLGGGPALANSEELLHILGSDGAVH